mmetsp:Transcript_38736/g.101219  ORF Transcript_38736/g.101219 Transcript_38736/m.101219 type:complete len:714 (+) Transcript_38736:95-2236(+)
MAAAEQTTVVSVVPSAEGSNARPGGKIGRAGTMIRDLEATEDSSSTRIHIARLMDSRLVDNLVMALVAAYFVLVFVQMVAVDSDGESNLTSEQSEILAIVDICILSFFLLEITLKIYAFGYLLYVNQPLLFLDAIIVVASMVVSVLDLVLGSEALARFSNLRAVLRLLRVIIVFRKASTAAEGMQEKKLLTGLGYNLASPAQEVIQLLKPLRDFTRLSYAQREDIRWAISVIDSGKLYEPLTDAESGGAPVDDTTAAWLVNATQGADRQRDRAVESEERDRPTKRKTAAEKRGSVSGPPGRLSIVGRLKSKDGVESAASLAAVEEPPVDKHDSSLEAKFRQFIKSQFPGADETQLFALMDTLLEWDYNVPKAEELSAGNALRVVTGYVMHRFDLYSSVGIHERAFGEYIAQVQEGYISSNPFHNATHGADVFASVLFLMTTGGLRETADVTDEEFFAALFAGAIHDLGHPAVNNIYCVKSRHPYALRYNDQSVLEMYHVAEAYRILRSDSKYDIFQSILDARYSNIRSVVVATVLATDMSHHFAELGKLKSRTMSGNFLQSESDSKSDRTLVFNVAVHACDISNPAKSIKTYLYWAERAIAEFFAQGDAEKKLGIPVSMFMDRSATNIAKCQIGFIDIIVSPLFAQLREVLPPLSVAVEQLQSNKTFWGRRVEQMEKEMTQGTQCFPVLHGDPDQPDSPTGEAQVSPEPPPQT